MKKKTQQQLKKDVARVKKIMREQMDITKRYRTPKKKFWSRKV